jgi:hypothetical protein
LTLPLVNFVILSAIVFVICLELVNEKQIITFNHPLECEAKLWFKRNHVVKYRQKCVVQSFDLATQIAVKWQTAEQFFQFLCWQVTFDSLQVHEPARQRSARFQAAMDILHRYFCSFQVLALEVLDFTHLLHAKF